MMIGLVIYGEWVVFQNIFLLQWFSETIPQTRICISVVNLGTLKSFWFFLERLKKLLTTRAIKQLKFVLLMLVINSQIVAALKVQSAEYRPSTVQEPLSLFRFRIMTELAFWSRIWPYLSSVALIRGLIYH